MPKPSRPGQNARRPRVAGLRKRETQPQGRSAHSGTEEAVAETTAVEPPVEESAAEERAAEERPTAAGADSAAEAEEPSTSEADSTGETSEVGSEDQATEDQATEDQATEDQATEVAGAVQPESAESAEPAGAEESAEAGNGARGRKLTLAMAALAVVCTVLAVWFGVQASAARGGGAAANEALVDAAVTSEVNGQVGEAVAKVFSYDFADTAKTEKAANELLVGEAVDKYNQLFATIRAEAPKQKLVVTTTVKASAVKLLQDDRAEVLVFVDQNAVRTDSGQNNVGPAQLLVGVEKHGDQWKINQITQS